ncbi:putative carbohydrate binding domain protein, partial [Vibrio parahaemolyticus AQ3810]
AKR